MDVLKDMKQIINQALGRENMFGFETTLANQLYLIFCCLGNVYYTNKISRKTKYVWFFWTYSILMMVAIASILYLIYGVKNQDNLLLSYVGIAIAVVFLELLATPVIAILWYRKNIEKMIAMTDEILLKIASHENLSNKYCNVKQLTVNAILGVWIPLLPYTCGTMLDIILFYEEHKVKNYLYYFVPLSGLEYYGSPMFYTIFSILTIWISLPFYVTCTAYPLFVVLWVAICCNETHRIVDQLNTSSTDAEINIGSCKTVGPKCAHVIKNSANDIDDLARMISCSKGFFEVTAGISMFIFLYFDIVHAMIFFSPNYSLMVKLKEISVFISTIEVVYIVCWMGAKLEELSSFLSFAVYSIPWYRLKIIRKDVHILLCQAQRPIKPMVFNAYPLTLKTFLRYCNIINSAVNIFRAYSGRE